MTRAADRPLPRARLRLAVARAAATLSRLALRVARRGATSLPGKLAIGVDPDLIARLRQHDPRLRNARFVMVSATNGKTTTATLLANVLAAAGSRVLHNAAGANLRSGVATVLLGARREVDVVLLEVDEATLPHVAPQVAPATLVLGNLFRDQLDRYGELDTVAAGWQRLLGEGHELDVLFNVDDPALATMLADTEAVAAEGFGIDDTSRALAHLPAYADAAFCPRCDAPLAFSAVQLGHLGHWRCPSCGNERPQPRHVVTSMRPSGLSGTVLAMSGAQFRVPMPGIYNVYNALAAVAAARFLGIDDRRIATGLTTATPAFGRFERIDTPGGGTLTLVLAKNPVGLSEVCRTIADAIDDAVPTVAMALNDGIADGRDTSWIWDASFADLPTRTRRFVATGTRAAELAVRLRYEGIDPDCLDLREDRRAVLEELLEDSGDAVFILTYTALLATYDDLSRRGLRTGFWDRPRSGAPSHA